MVETAPLPPGFGVVPHPAAPPAEETADSSAQLETRATPPRHPLEAWADPSPFEQPISRPLPGGGYLAATRTALENYAAGERRIREMIGPGILHASEIAARQRQAEDAAEAKRKAETGRPLAVLRQAHRLQAEALAEVDRIEPLVARARELVAEIEGRARRQAAAATAARAAAADALIEAIAAGTDRPVETPLDTAEAEATAAELATARAARGRLESELTAARDLLVRRGHGVERCAVAVLTDQAAELANEILDAAAELEICRADLDALGRLLTSENRRLNASAPPLPAQVNRALYPADRQLTGTAPPLPASDWRAAYAALVDGEVDATADPVEAETP